MEAAGGSSISQLVLTQKNLLAEIIAKTAMNQANNELLSVLTREGVLINVSVRYWRGQKKLRPEDIGLNSSNCFRASNQPWTYLNAFRSDLRPAFSSNAKY